MKKPFLFSFCTILYLYSNICLGQILYPKISYILGKTIVADTTTCIYFPHEIDSFCKQKGLKYFFSMNPFYLRGDFNGDGFPDLAIQVTYKEKRGILIYHSHTKQFYLIGAGIDNWDHGDDFYWNDCWFVSDEFHFPFEDYSDNKKAAKKNKRIANDILYVAESSSVAAIIAWDGQGYCYFVLGGE